MQTAGLQNGRLAESMRFVLFYNPSSPGHRHLRGEVERSRLLRVKFVEIGLGVSPRLVTPSGSFWRGTRVIRNVLIRGRFLNTFRTTEEQHGRNLGQKTGGKEIF